MRRERAARHYRRINYTFWILSFTLILMCPVYSAAQSSGTQSGQQGKVQSTINDPPDLKDRLSTLEQKLDILNNRIDSELKASNTRFDGAMRSTERDFYILIAVGALGSLFSGGFVILSWARDLKNYGQERNFQARRVLRVEQQQKAASQRETQLSDKFLARYDAMLSSQLDSIGKIGNVINLVNQVFDVQLKHQTGTVELQKEIDKLKGVLQNLDRHYETQYSAARQLILTFERKTRMDWPRLTKAEQDLAANARIIFNFVPESLIKQKDEETPSDLAQVYQFLGASAFYANDVEAAEKMLQKAYLVYSRLQGKGSTATKAPHAACCYFLALIEKNWLSNGRDIEENLAEAKRYLEEAVDLLNDKFGEFLNPLTLAEVLSYSQANRLSARRILDETLETLNGIPKRDPNQESLLQRAYLLRGNLDFLDGLYDPAYKCYEEAYSRNVNNPYALFSMAQIKSLKGLRQESHHYYQEGLDKLKQSKALEKQELSGRVLALVWAIIASHELEDRSQEDLYWNEMAIVGESAGEVNKRKPLLFSPATKTIDTFEHLKQTLQYEMTRSRV